MEGLTMKRKKPKSGPKPPPELHLDPTQRRRRLDALWAELRREREKSEQEEDHGQKTKADEETDETREAGKARGHETENLRSIDMTIEKITKSYVLASGLACLGDAGRACNIWGSHVTGSLLDLLCDPHSLDRHSAEFQVGDRLYLCSYADAAAFRLNIRSEVGSVIILAVRRPMMSADGHKRALYVRAYDEPEEQAPKTRQFPEVLKPRREAPKRETSRRSDVSDDDDDDNGGLGTFPRRGYVEAWGNHEPTAYDVRQWDKAVRTAAKIGVSPTQLGKLRDALLEDAPIDADGDGGDYSPSDYLPVPVSMPNDADWLTYRGASEIAARHGVSPQAFRELSTFVLTVGQGLGEPQLIRMQAAAVDALALEHGSGTGSVVRSAQKAIAHFGAGLALKPLFDSPGPGGVGIGDQPALISLLARVGEAIAFDSLPREFKSISGNYAAPRDRGNPVNQQSALDEIKRLSNERRKVSTGSFEWRELTEQLGELHKVAYPGNQGDDDDSRNGLGSLNRMGRR